MLSLLYQCNFVEVLCVFMPREPGKIQFVDIAGKSYLGNAKMILNPKANKSWKSPEA